MTTCGKLINPPAASPVFFRLVLRAELMVFSEHGEDVTLLGLSEEAGHGLMCPSVPWIMPIPGTHFSHDTMLTKIVTKSLAKNASLTTDRQKPKGKQKKGHFRLQSIGKNMCQE